jgi:HEAT repeat protein
MKAAQRSTLFQGGLLALALLVVGYFAWQRYHPPSLPMYEGKTLDQWIEDLGDPDNRISDRAADVLADAGVQAVPYLLDAREQSDLRLHRRAVAVLVRIGSRAAAGLVAALRDKPKEQRIEVALVRLGPEAMPVLRQALAEERGSETVVHVLGLIGPRAADAVPDLIALLQRGQTPTKLRSEAAFALGRIGEPVGDIVPALSVALQDSKLEVRLQAAEALGWIGPPAREAVPALVAALKDEESKVVRKACQALSFIGDEGAVQALMTTFLSDGVEIAAAAGRALWQLGPKAEQVVPALLSAAEGPINKSAPARALLASFGQRVVPFLVKALGDNEAARREAAAEVLGRIGPPARADGTVVPALIAALKDKSSTVALTAAMALAQIDATRAGAAVPLLVDSLDVPGAAVALANIGPDARSAVPALIAALKARKQDANQESFRAGARLALARIGKPAVPALLAALRDKQDDVAPLAGEALGWVLPPPKEAVPALREALRNDRAHAAIYAHALGQLGSLARPALPELTELLTDPASRSEAAVAMVSIAPDQADRVVALLIKDLQASDEKQRQAAVLALARLGPVAAPAVDALMASLRHRKLEEMDTFALRQIGASAVRSLAGLLKDPHADFRKLSAFVLGEIGSDARPALPALIAALADSDSEVRARASHVLEEIGPEAAEAVPSLIANLQAYQTQVRYSAALALGHIGPGAKAARKPLMECLLDLDEHVRYAAALSQGRIDLHFTEAVPALSAALHDASPMVRLAAIDSLGQIDHDAAVRDGVPVLVALCNKPEDLDVRFHAAEGLGELAPEEAKRAVVPWLLIELNDPNPGSALYAARLVARIDPARHSDLVLALAGQLRTPLPDVRRALLKTLGEFGPKAREAVPEIERQLYDGALGVREDAIRALRAINPVRLRQLGFG